LGLSKARGVEGEVTVDFSAGGIVLDEVEGRLL
jgi:hypothetical protein